MTKDDTAALKIFETRAGQLMLSYERMREQLHDLQSKVASLSEELESERKKCDELSKKYDTLKLAKMIDVSDAEYREAKQRIGKLIQEIDKCIAMLNI